MGRTKDTGYHHFSVCRFNLWVASGQSHWDDRPYAVGMYTLCKTLYLSDSKNQNTWPPTSHRE
jgi:hypothetical protein